MDIKRARAKAGMTQQGLAVALGVAVATVYRWEAGISKPSPLAAKALDAILARKQAP
jgi:DNA-binding transcriptional regulator YiaG